MDVAINYLAVVGATVVNMVLGFLLYGPVLGKVWMREMGFSGEHMSAAQQKGMTKTYIIMGLSALVLNYVLAHFVVLLNIVDTTMALQLAFFSWLGFIATTMLGQVLWEGKSWTLYAINAGYYLVALGVAAVILVSFPV